MARNADSFVLESVFDESMSVGGERIGLGEGVIVGGVFSGDDGKDESCICYGSG